jgi:hypothetical protein
METLAILRNMSLSPEYIADALPCAAQPNWNQSMCRWFDAVSLGQFATGARSAGAACAVVHSLCGRAQADGFSSNRPPSRLCLSVIAAAPQRADLATLVKPLQRGAR